MRGGLEGAGQDGGAPFCDSQNQCAAGLWAPQAEGLGWFVNNTQFIAIWPRTIRKFSPTSPSETAEDPPDSDKIRQTIAHEIGHAIRVGGDANPESHVPVSWMQCPLSSSQRTVMVSGYHVDTFMDPQQQKVCAWNDTPTQYRTIERDNFRLR